MSVVIVGGNDCMIRKYKELCDEYKCKAKIFTHMTSSMKSKLGTPDLLVLFTSTMSHKMLKTALSETKGQQTTIARSHSSSMSALRSILEKYAIQE